MNDELINYVPERYQLYQDNSNNEKDKLLQPGLLSAKLQVKENDLYVFREIEDLRTEFESYYPDYQIRDIESEDKWEYMKNRVAKELKYINDGLLVKILKKAYPFLDSMESSHSIGHCTRDLIHISQILNNVPDNTHIDDVELMVGMLGGVFHDIGVSIRHRYQEKMFVTGHPEAGAYLFGILAESILPDELIKMVQYAIAAHTHHEKVITYDDVNIIRRPYQTKVNQLNNSKIGIVITRGADRGDIIAPEDWIRHMIGTIELVSMCLNGVDHNWDGTNQSGFNFQHEITEEYVSSIANMHKIFYQSAIDAKNWHSQDDPEWLRNQYILPAAQLMNEVNITLMAEHIAEENSTQAINNNLYKFLLLCLILEPGPDIKDRMLSYSEKFHNLRPEIQRKWAAAFNTLENVYNQKYKIMIDQTRTIPKVIIQNTNNAVRSLGTEIYKLAQEVLPCYNPKYIYQPHNEWPNIRTILSSALGLNG